MKVLAVILSLCVALSSAFLGQYSPNYYGLPGGYGGFGLGYGGLHGLSFRKHSFFGRKGFGLSKGFNFGLHGRRQYGGKGYGNGLGKFPI